MTLYDYVTSSDFHPPGLYFSPEEAMLYEDFFMGSNELHQNLFETLIDEINFESNLFWDRGPLYRNPTRNYWSTIKGGLQRLNEGIVSCIGRDKIVLGAKVKAINVLQASD